MGFSWRLLRAATLLVTGCSLTLNVEQEQCAADGDCAALGLAGICEAGVCVESVGAGASGGTGGSGGGEPDPLWGCLGNVPPPEVDPNEIVTRIITLRGLGTTLPEVGSVVYCDNLDITCANPEMTQLESGEDEIGQFMKVSFDVPEGTNGFLEINGPTLKPTLLALGQANSETAVQDSAVTMVETVIFDTVTANAGFAADPERGTLLALITDCNLDPAADSTISSPQVDDMATVFYYVNELPSADPTSTEGNGFSGILNLPTGTASATTFNQDGIAIGTVSFHIRAGWLTFIAIEPTP